MKNIFRVFKVLCVFVLLVMSLLGCSVVHNYKEYYLNRTDQAFGPRNGVEKGSIILSCDVRDYGFKQDNVKKVYITCQLNHYSVMVGKRDENIEMYKVKFKGINAYYIFPMEMRLVSENIYRKKILFPDGYLSYYFNITLNNTNKCSRSYVYSSKKGSLYYLERDKNNVAMELVDSFGHNSVIIIKNGKLDRIYDKKIINDQGLKRYIPKLFLPYRTMPIEDRKRL